MIITLGNTQLNNDNCLLTGVGGLSFPTISFSIQDKGGFNGRKVSRSSLRSYSFSTSWLVSGSSFENVQNERDSLITAIGAILSQGSQLLKISRWNAKDVQIEVKSVKLTGDIKAEDGISHTILIEFEAEYPLLQSQSEIIQTISIFAGGGMSIPMGIPMNMGVGGSSSIVVTNEGQYDAYPIVTLYGPLENPVIKNVTTDKSLNFTYNLLSNNYVVIDTYLRTAVLYPSAVNVRRYVSGSFWTLGVGNNQIRLSATAYNTQGKAIIRFRNHYLGI